MADWFSHRVVGVVEPSESDHVFVETFGAILLNPMKVFIGQTLVALLRSSQSDVCFSFGEFFVVGFASVGCLCGQLVCRDFALQELYARIRPFGPSLFGAREHFTGFAFLSQLLVCNCCKYCCIRRMWIAFSPVFGSMARVKSSADF